MGVHIPSIANKADLVNGTIPLAQLGTGTPDANKVLKGDGTWGAGGGGTLTETHIPMIGLAVAQTI